jgi:hypothetical protein
MWLRPASASPEKMAHFFVGPHSVWGSRELGIKQLAAWFQKAVWFRSYGLGRRLGFMLGSALAGVALAFATGGLTRCFTALRALMAIGLTPRPPPRPPRPYAVPERVVECPMAIAISEASHPAATKSALN